jgi:hypothetical protein
MSSRRITYPILGVTAKKSTRRMRVSGLHVLRDLCNLMSATIRPFGSGPPYSTSHLGYVVQCRFSDESRPYYLKAGDCQRYDLTSKTSLAMDERQ